MPRRPKPPARPVEPDEPKAAILCMIVREFGERPPSWETVEEALREVNMRVLRGGGRHR